jgi:hypothetical protein
MVALVRMVLKEAAVRTARRTVMKSITREQMAMRTAMVPLLQLLHLPWVASVAACSRLAHVAAAAVEVVVVAVVVIVAALPLVVLMLAMRKAMVLAQVPAVMRMPMQMVRLQQLPMVMVR